PAPKSSTLANARKFLTITLSEASPSPDAAAKENSAVAVAPPEPERKPMPPAPTHQATPKAREGSVVAEVAPPAVSKKRAAYKTRTGKKHASAYRHKRSYAHKKHRKPRYAVAHGRKHRAYAAGVVYVQRRCDCRCGRAFYKPRKRRHAAWHGYGSPRRSGLTYRRGRHYIR
ncbi:MAG: hypothetical protein Q8K85_18940, partial [Hyphomicrobium sp.]|nr:hypothetical protein [Hyphomicrobium sp.]